MRDAAIALMLLALVVAALRFPWVGIMGWTLTSLMSPHAEFGYAAAYWPVAMVIAASTLVGFVFAPEKRQNPFVGAAPKLLLALTLWITITLPFSIFVADSTPLWERSMKIFLMVFVTLAVLTDRVKLNTFVWINAIAIGYYGIKGGAFTILTAGSYRVWGPGGFIEGNNELGLAVCTVTPLFRYLQLQMSHKWAKLSMTAAIGLCVLMALGTHSRGALVGMAAMLLVFWWRNDKKALWGTLILAGGALALSLMPAHWWERMNTIKTYQEDDSALGRLNAWDMAIRVANDRITGGGFSMWGSAVFRMYSPNPERHHAAHSIYFQVLGEQGWIGLLLFLGIGVATWMSCSKLRKLGSEHAELRWASDLGGMVQVSMVGYGVAGAFLSLTWFDLPYNLMIMAVVGRRLAEAEAEQLLTARRAAALAAQQVAKPQAKPKPIAPQPRHERGWGGHA